MVFGIVGRALKEHVFGSLFFGGDQELLITLSKQEKELAHLDGQYSVHHPQLFEPSLTLSPGFFRTKRRADTIRQHQTNRDGRALGMDAAIKLTLQLERLLLPLWKLGGSAPMWKSSDKQDKLAEIVGFAANLSHIIRQDADTVYYWPPTFKDEEFGPSRMGQFLAYDCLSDMSHTHRVALRHR